MSRDQIALALSGGGIRAMMFHLGVLRFMAERQALERVHRISSVSGGSLLVGLVLQEADLQWPTSDLFLTSVYPNLRRKLCERSLQWGALRQLASPPNLRFLLSRANLLALALEQEWGVSARLADLPTTPEISLNGTTAENGKRFRFKRDSMGDYQIGYATPGDFPLANALAVSAAFPGGFGPLTLDAHRFDWRRRAAWDAPAETAASTGIGYHHLHLYDGGVYDNLGLEPFFDAGRGTPKSPGEVIIVSDAGAPLSPGFSSAAFNPWRLKRVADIMSEQSRALRVRTFAHYLQQGPHRGAYLYIGLPVDQACAVSAKQASNYPTTLTRPTQADFDIVAKHGYHVASKAGADFGLPPAALVHRNRYPA